MGSGHEPQVAHSDRSVTAGEPHEARLRLDPGDVHLWVALPARCGAPELLARYASLLSADERARWTSYRFERHRLEYLVTRALIRSVLSSYGPLRPAEWHFTRNAFGRPELDPGFALRFSIANSPTLVACAVSRDEVGVDVEPLARGADVLRVAGSVLSPRERAALAALPATELADRALTLWTLKEAYVKGRGRGLSMPLDALTFTVEDGRASLEVGSALHDGSAWQFRIVNRADHRISVAHERADSRELFLRITEAIPLLEAAAPCS
jgi:4'-phosphopantetheinyl transferase